MIPDGKWSPDRKWSPNWTANDPELQMIPDVDRKWSRRKTRNGMGFVPPVEVSIFNLNRNLDPKNKLHAIPRFPTGSKNKECHGFISEEGENMYKNYELKNILSFYKKNVPQLLFCSSKKQIVFIVMQ